MSVISYGSPISTLIPLGGIRNESTTSSKNKILTWQALGLMTFSSVWGFGNIVNATPIRTQAVVSWIIMFTIYFIPYTLMVGEMGSTFKDSQGGVSSWIRSTSSAKLAYFAGWTYWICHMPYLAQKPQSMLVALGWAIFRNGSLTKMMSPWCFNPLLSSSFSSFYGMPLGASAP